MRDRRWQHNEIEAPPVQGLYMHMWCDVMWCLYLQGKIAHRQSNANETE